ncbi:MAG: DinB family protein [Chloroflexi bacterium]|nr:DinB family protein [Chloroflexota bacterium]
MTQNDYRSFRQQWNNQQKELRALLGNEAQHQQALDLFMRHHAALHSTQITQLETWSYVDDLLNDMTENQIRHIPPNSEHSAAWLLWHMARIEDIAMNTLVAGRTQILYEDNWQEQMKATLHHTGNEMDAAGVAHFSVTVDIEALRAYRLAVGKRTREIVAQLRPQMLKQKVDPLRIKQVHANGDVLESASSITDYWSKRTITGLLLMPATRHNMVHLNEIEKLKKKRGF